MLQLICGSRRWLWVGNCPRKPLRRCIHWALLVIRSLPWLDFLYGFCIHVISYSLQRYSSFILPCSASSVLGITYDKEGVKFTCCDLRLLCAFFFSSLTAYLFSFYCHISLEAAFDQSTVSWTCVGFSTFISSGLHLHFQFFLLLGSVTSSKLESPVVEEKIPSDSEVSTKYNYRNLMGVWSIYKECLIKCVGLLEGCGLDYVTSKRSSDCILQWWCTRRCKFKLQRSNLWFVSYLDLSCFFRWFTPGQVYKNSEKWPNNLETELQF